MNQSFNSSVKRQYGAVARSGLSSRDAGIRAVASAFGYRGTDLDAIPAEANLGLSCGNPTAFASLRPGETVVDLGSGGGLDVFLAAGRVGPGGRAIGIDMTPEMVELSRRNAERLRAERGLENVEFHLAAIDRIPLQDASVDCVISNCVINLAVDKPAVFREIARILRPSGRLAVSDIALKQALPEELAGDLTAYVGCVAGAILIDDYRRGLREAGFAEVDIRGTGADLNAYALAGDQSMCCSPAMSQTAGLEIADCCSSGGDAQDDGALHSRLAALLRRYDVNAYAASVRIYAVMPGAAAARENPAGRD